MELVEIHNREPVTPTAVTVDDERAGLRAVINIFARWRVTEEQCAILLDTSVSSLRRWKSGAPARLGRDQVTRISNFLGIHKALRLIFSEAHIGYAWVTKPNKAFNDQSALEVMLEGGLPAIMRVRRYLDSQRGAW